MVIKRIGYEKYKKYPIYDNSVNPIPNYFTPKNVCDEQRLYHMRLIQFFAE